MPKITARFAAVMGASALVLALAGPALAIDGHQDFPISWDNAGLQGSEEECATDLATWKVPAGQVLWHFVQTEVEKDADLSNSLLSIDVSPKGAGAEDANDIPANDQNGPVLNWWVVTPKLTVEGISTNVTGGENSKLNISHICVAPAEETATPSDDTEEDTATPSDETQEETSTLPTGTPSSGFPVILVLGIAGLAVVLLATAPVAKRNRR